MFFKTTNLRFYKFKYWYQFYDLHWSTMGTKKYWPSSLEVNRCWLLTKERHRHAVTSGFASHFCMTAGRCLACPVCTSLSWVNVWVGNSLTLFSSGIGDLKLMVKTRCWSQHFSKRTEFRKWRCHNFCQHYQSFNVFEY